MSLHVGSQPAPYITDIENWRRTMDERLRAENGWLALVGLYWLREGVNTLGGDPSADISLPGDIPPGLGSIQLLDEQVSIELREGAGVTVDGETVPWAILRDDSAEAGASVMKIGSLTFVVIKRGSDYAVRVWDSQNPALTEFTGRKWYPIDEGCRVKGRFIPHAEPRTVQVVTSADHIQAMKNPGRVAFALDGQTLSLEAFASGEDMLWFVFQDGTSGETTYGAGRFLYAPLDSDGGVIVDFNKAYHPPCAFTPYATCPRPMKENILIVSILAGEHL